MSPARFESLILLALALLLLYPDFAGAGETSKTPFHVGTGKDQPAWSEKAKKRMEACAADYLSVLRGQKPVYAQPDPAEESTANDQFYQGDRYQIHVTRS